MEFQFDIATADQLRIDDSEIFNLLELVYVAGGFTSPAEAASLFNPSAVRERGVLIAARERHHSRLAGMVIVVPPNSPFSKYKNPNAAEIHLLGVIPEYRRHGLGRMLIETAIAQATNSGYLKLILWTQLSMDSAHRLYESTGFIHIDNIERNGRHYKVYEHSFQTDD